MTAALRALHENKDLSLTFNRRNTAYPAATFNLGPQSACCMHLDQNDSPGIPCAVQALGDFDHTVEGHLIFNDLKIAVQFPAGATALFPSALLRHGNTAIVKSKSRRYSITQYCAGGLMRWFEYGQSTGVDLQLSDPDKYADLTSDATNAKRKADMYSRYSKAGDLARDLYNSFGIKD
jgi:hypothetical protein